MAIQQFETAHLQIVRKLCCLLFAALLTVSCGKHEEEPDPTGPAAHTFLLYMPGRSLLSYYEINIRRIERAVATGALSKGRVLVCYQPESNESATMLEIRYDRQTQTAVRETVAVYDTFEAGETASVDALFRDVQQLAPAKSYGLAIGCHGSAWLPVTSTISLPLHKDEVLPVTEWMTRAENPYRTESGTFTRAIGDSGHRLEIGELASVAEQLPFRFDYLIFDACFMANIETLYDLRDAFDYVIGAPCEIMASGFPYDLTIPELFVSGGPDLPQVCYGFWDYYMNAASYRSGCISLAVMGELEALADRVADIQAGPLRGYLLDELQYYEGCSTHLFYDFGQYIRAICDDAELYRRFEEQLDRAFPTGSRLNTPEFYSDYNRRMNAVTHYSGVSTSEPALRLVEQERETAWFRRTHAVD